MKQGAPGGYAKKARKWKQPKGAECSASRNSAGRPEGSLGGPPPRGCKGEQHAKGVTRDESHAGQLELVSLFKEKPKSTLGHCDRGRKARDHWGGKGYLRSSGKKNRLRGDQGGKPKRCKGTAAPGPNHPRGPKDLPEENKRPDSDNTCKLKKQYGRGKNSNVKRVRGNGTREPRKEPSSVKRREGQATNSAQEKKKPAKAKKGRRETEVRKGPKRKGAPSAANQQAPNNNPEGGGREIQKESERGKGGTKGPEKRCQEEKNRR